MNLLSFLSGNQNITILIITFWSIKFLQIKFNIFLMKMKLIIYSDEIKIDIWRGQIEAITILKTFAKIYGEQGIQFLLF